MPALDYAKIADLYDVYVQTDMDVPFFLQEARGCQKVLELTAGTGRLSIPLIEAGVPLSCLDSSPDMLAILRGKLALKGLSAPIYEMDVSHFTIPGPFDLILFPFNTFSEINDPAAQQATLASIRTHLAEAGRAIITLHNPAVRLRNIDDRIHLRGKYALPDDQGTLALTAFESYDPVSRLVSGCQFYEIYDRGGVMQAKRFVELHFTVHSKESFEALVHSTGLWVEAIYGDYERRQFAAEKSPYMIWILKFI